MADAGPTSVDPTSGFYWRASQWVSRRAREGIRDALGYDLPITFPSPPWTKRSAMPGVLCWSRHFVQSDDSDAVEYVSTSGSAVRFCGACFKHWREEAQYLSSGGYRH
jgi:hypothetical protein